MKKFIYGTLTGICLIVGGIALYVILSSNSMGKSARQDRAVKFFEDDYKPMNGIDSAYAESLKDIGFVNAENVVSNEKNASFRFWKEKYNMSFRSEESVKKFLRDNDFIMGEAKKYKGVIPIEAGRHMMRMYLLVKDEVKTIFIRATHENISYQVSRNDMSDRYGQPGSWREYGMLTNLAAIVKPKAMTKYSIADTPFWEVTEIDPKEKIMIIGPASKFDVTGMQLVDGFLKKVPPSDPIAVLKVDGGYVELAHW